MKLIKTKLYKFICLTDKKYRVLSLLSFTQSYDLLDLSKQTQIPTEELVIILDILAKEKFAAWRNNGVCLYSLSGFVRYKQEKRCRIISRTIQAFTFIIAAITLYFTIK